MKILVKTSKHAISSLLRANIPSLVVEGIIGRTFLASDNIVIKVQWLDSNNLVDWTLPADAVTILPEESCPKFGQNPVNADTETNQQQRES